MLKKIKNWCLERSEVIQNIFSDPWKKWTKLLLIVGIIKAFVRFVCPEVLEKFPHFFPNIFHVFTNVNSYLPGWVWFCVICLFLVFFFLEALVKKSKKELSTLEKRDRLYYKKGEDKPICLVCYQDDGKTYYLEHDKYASMKCIRCNRNFEFGAPLTWLDLLRMWANSEKSKDEETQKNEQKS